MDILQAIGGSGALGGLFGALGSGLSRLVGIYEMREKRKDRVLEMSHDKDRWAHETGLQTAQFDARANEQTQGLRQTETEGSWAGLKASIDADASLSSDYGWVEAVRAMVRPVLTVLIWLVFSLLFFASSDLRLPPQVREDIILTFVNTVTFSASTALAWWFGDRGPRLISGLR